MQFNRDASGKMTPLPKPSIDTGMGLERIASLIQNVPSNYDTDLIMPIIQKVEDLSEKRMVHSTEDDIAMKVIADHSRAAAFLIGDGILPSNEGRGYVLRRIMRRAIRYGRNIGLTSPFLHKTAGVVFDIMQPAYPELSESSAFITNVIENEEVRFFETLDNGLKLLTETLANMRVKGQNTVPGDVIFKLYDTFGFPLDIVRDVVRDEKMSLDIDGFDEAMNKQRAKSRSVTTFSKMGEAYKNLSAMGIRPEFVGYVQLTVESKVLILVEGDQEVNTADVGTTIEVVTETTPFYGEAGGQAGDTGKITGQNFKMDVLDTIKDPTGRVIHKGKVISGKIKKGDLVTLSVDKDQRDATALSHTATHILHAILCQVLGDHVKQSGSLVAPGRLRFDFTHFSQVEISDLDKIESLVNERIRANIPVQVEEMEAEEAFKTGATALFEEKYGDRVRVVSLSDFSKELCGGTHTSRTGNIGLFKIMGESAVASGIRRIEALVGQAALAYTQQISKIVRETAHLVKEKPEVVPQRIENILSNQKSLEKEVEQLKARIASKSADESENAIRLVKNIRVLVKKVPVDTPAALRDLADRFKEKIKSGVVVLGCVSGIKVLLIVVVTKDLTDRLHAGNIVKKIAAVVGGGGGGRPDMAQAGGTKPENLDQALEKVYEVLENS
jgi:alanyl-tRNA synthetase